ncbi:DNA topoisomerase 2-alpha-like [Daphnia pulicaria]|uniref:DNA topoisomerase 2-alpha-like n=1 Tax=Daphnia pulicaria TaxID=35523 RepID=UPI001EEBED87|nr:DNA topoisomerase 2-alpha-like [Daphnia pulicaria]
MASKSEDYDYLLSFFKPPYNLTRGGKAETLLANRVPVMKSYHIISEKSPEDLWREDLAKLSEILPEPASSEAKPTKSSTKKKSRQEKVTTPVSLSEKLCFSPKHIGEQKYWLNSYNDACKLLRRQGLTEDVYGKETKPISFYDFIKKDMVRYFKMEYERSTPSLIDGLKLEQRKVLFTVLNRNDKDVNVARPALTVAEHTALL